jgi:predicted TIM-barrel fold metal-dependent hydrolase
MIVETHCHVVAPDQEKYPRRVVEGFLGAWVRDMSTEELLGHMREAGVDRGVLVQAFGAYQGDNNYVADSVARYPDRFAGVFSIDPLQQDAPEQIAYWTRERRLHGGRLVTMTRPEVALNDPRMIPIFQQVANMGIPLCLLTRFRQLQLLPPLLERFPGVPVALDHMGAPNLSAGPPYSEIQPLLDLARFPNCYLKLSTVSIDAAMAGRSTPGEFFRLILDSFGARRLMWGSNFPATYDRSLRQQVELARTQLSFLSAEEQRWVFGETALSLWPKLR